MSDAVTKSLDELIEDGTIELTRGKIISKKDMLAYPGPFPVYSSAKENDGKFGEYGKYMFDEELITWSVDGGGRPFYRPRHKFSVTNVGGILRIKNKSLLGYRYLHYVLSLRHSQTEFDWVRKAHPSVIRKLYRDIPLPSLPEQQRIVAILDDAFAVLATASANAEKNLKNARELFESQLETTFTRHNAEWSQCSLDQICSFTSGGTPSKANLAYWNGDIPWVSGKDMKSDRISDAALHISQEAVEASATRIAPVGSLLVLVRGMGLANGIALAELISPCAFNQDIKAVHPNRGINPRFLLHALRSRFARSPELLSNAAHGTLKVEMEALRNVLLRIPPVQVQEKIASQIDSLATETEALARLYSQKADALMSLKQALLQKALSGDLTSPPSQATKEAAE